MKKKEIKRGTVEYVLQRTFHCPICDSDIERINEHLAKAPIDAQLKIGLINKRSHFAMHREEKRKKEKELRRKEKELRRTAH